MENATVLALYLFVARPPRPNTVQVPSLLNKDTRLDLQFRLSLEQFFSFLLLAIVTWLWWTQINSSVEWEITSVVFLKLITTLCNFLYRQHKNKKSITFRQKRVAPQIVSFMFIIVIWIVLIVFGVSSNSSNHPLFGAFVFTVYLFIFMAFQFDYIHLEDEI